jgi:hypothetical protein
MTNADIKGYLSALTDISVNLEEAYIEGGGEITEETEALERRADAIRQLLQGDGIDSLGRWLRSQEDRVAAIKAEKDALARQQKAAERTVEYIKGEIGSLMGRLGIDKAKGACYSFTPSTKSCWTVDREKLNDEWKGIAMDAARKAGVPEWVKVSVDVTVSAIDREAVPDCVQLAQFPSVTFRKPRADKEGE